MLKKIKVIGGSIAYFTPILALAQGGGLDVIETNIVTPLASIVAALLPVVVGIAVLVFFWGLVKYIFAQGSEESKADGKKIMFWGAVALFIMFSIWGIIQLAQQTFDVEGGAPGDVGDIVPGGIE